MKRTVAYEMRDRCYWKTSEKQYMTKVIIVCSQVREIHSLPERDRWTFLALDGIDGEVLWHRLSCPDKVSFLCEENEDSEIFNGYPYTCIRNSTYTFQLWSEFIIKTQIG